MLGTNFFKDMGVSSPKMKGCSAAHTANYIVNSLLKGKKTIYPGFHAKLAKALPSYINAMLLDTTEMLEPLLDNVPTD